MIKKRDSRPVRLSLELIAFLDKKKLVPEEHYDSVIRRLIRLKRGTECKRGDSNV